MARRKTDLKKRAERKLAARAKGKQPQRSQLVHELEVHKVELELQNEELVAARERLEATLVRYTEVFDFAPIGYVTLDTTGVIRELNHAGARLLGVERLLLVGRQFALSVAGRSLATFHGLVGEAHDSTVAVSCELDLRRAPLSFPARLTAVVLRHREPMVMIAFEDISERRAREDDLARVDVELRESNQRKDDFLAMLSHELRNPLSPIRTSVAVLQIAEPGSAIATESLAIIDRSAAHLSRLVDDLLDITRITHGKIELRREVVELTALIRRAVDDQSHPAMVNRLEIITRLPPGQLLVYADPGRLAQVISNVLGNAVKFTPKGGRIVVELREEDSSALIRIVDNGIGIAPDQIGDLARPFAQVPQALDRNRGGLGLGLAMVKSLVQLDGGHITLRSAGLGRGTEVTITLPVHEALSPRPAELAPVTARRRVLIVEDSPDTARSMQQALQLRGHDVEVAADGFTGLERLAAFKPEVVLCDIGLPEMDGFAFAMRVRADEALRDVYLIALSGYARAEEVARAKAAGFDRHLAKPPRLDEIDRLLAELRPRKPDPFDHNTLH